MVITDVYFSFPFFVCIVNEAGTARVIVFSCLLEIKIFTQQKYRDFFLRTLLLLAEYFLQTFSLSDMNTLTKKSHNLNEKNKFIIFRRFFVGTK